MITVTILINGNPILTRSAVNKGKHPSGYTRYDLDDGSHVLHKPKDGAVILAKMMLDSIRVPEEEPRAW